MRTQTKESLEKLELRIKLLRKRLEIETPGVIICVRQAIEHLLDIMEDIQSHADSP